MKINIVKNHRTILFVDARDQSSTFKERANRLIESLNGSNIKVDVHAVTSGGGISVVPVASLDEEEDYSYVGDGFDIEALRSVAREYGYDQVIFSVAP